MADSENVYDFKFITPGLKETIGLIKDLTKVQQDLNRASQATEKANKQLTSSFHSIASLPLTKLTLLKNIEADAVAANAKTATLLKTIKDLAKQDVKNLKADLVINTPESLINRTRILTEQDNKKALDGIKNIALASQAASAEYINSVVKNINITKQFMETIKQANSFKLTNPLLAKVDELANIKTNLMSVNKEIAAGSIGIKSWERNMLDAYSKIQTATDATSKNIVRVQAGFRAYDPYGVVGGSTPSKAEGPAPLTAPDRYLMNPQEYKTAMDEYLKSLEEAKSGGKKKLKGIKDDITDFHQHIVLSWRSVARVIAGTFVSRIVTNVITSMVQAIKGAIEFSRRIAEIQTVSQGAQLSTQRWTDEVRALSEEFGKPIFEVAEGTYQALSNQVAEGAEVTGFMREALELSLNTISKTEDAVDALTGVMFSYSDTIGRAAQRQAQLFKAVELGRFRLEDVSDSLGRVSVFANQAGISFEEMSAAIISLNKFGVPVSEAMTFVRNVIQKLIQPTEKMSELFAKWGATSGEAAIKAEGFSGVLAKIFEEADKSGDPIAFLVEQFSLLRGSIGAIGLRQVQDDLRQTTKEMENAGESAKKAGELIRESLGQKTLVEIEKIKNFFLLDFGTEFIKNLYALQPIIGGVAYQLKNITFFISKFLEAGVFIGIAKFINYLISFKTAADGVTKSLKILNLTSKSLAFLGTAGGIGAAAFIAFETTLYLMDRNNKRMRELEEKLTEENRKQAEERIKITNEEGIKRYDAYKKLIDQTISAQQKLINDVQAQVNNYKAKGDLFDELLGLSNDPDLLQRRIEHNFESIKEAIKSGNFELANDLIGASKTLISTVEQSSEDEAEAFEKKAERIQKAIDASKKFNKDVQNTLLSVNLDIINRSNITANRKAQSANYLLAQQINKTYAEAKAAIKRGEYETAKELINSGISLSGQLQKVRTQIRPETAGLVVPRFKTVDPAQQALTNFKNLLEQISNVPPAAFLEKADEQINKVSRLNEELKRLIESSLNFPSRREIALGVDGIIAELERLKSGISANKTLENTSEVAKNNLAALEQSTRATNENIAAISTNAGILAEELGRVKKEISITGLEGETISEFVPVFREETEKLQNILKGGFDYTELKELESVIFSMPIDKLGQLNQQLLFVRQQLINELVSADSIRAQRLALLDQQVRVEEEINKINSGFQSMNTTIIQTTQTTGAVIEQLIIKLQELVALQNALNNNAANEPVTPVTGQLHGGYIKRFANGGPVASDNILSYLSPGEFVTNARQTRANFSVLNRINSGINVGDINVNVSSYNGSTSARDIGKQIRREIQRGTLR